MKLSHKGFILVLVPLVFEFGFMGCLLSMLDQTEVEIQKEEQARRVVAHLNKIFTLIMVCCGGMTQYGKDTERPYLTKFQASRREIMDEFSTLERLTAHNPKQLEMVKEIHSRFVAGLVQMAKIKELFNNGEILSASIALKQMEPLSSAITLSAQRALDCAEQELAQGPDIQARQRQQLRDWLLAGLLINAVMAMGLALYFNQGTARRLAVLMDNTKRLTENKPLHNPVGGSDEIAHLDKVFREMADALKSAANMKRDFVAMLSHDLRSPLNSIEAFLTLLHSGVYGEINEKGSKKAESLEGTVRWLVKLIGDLLDMDRIEAGLLDLELKPTSLLHIVDQSIEALRSLAEKRDIKIVVDETDASVNADSDRLIRVITNFISNAIKFSPEHSTINVRVINDNNMATLEVQDEGQGIPQENQDAVFERFRQVKNPAGKGGAGLGLAVARAIVEQHGGTIGVRSENGQGSTFWFRMPAASPIIATISDASSSVTPT